MAVGKSSYSSLSGSKGISKVVLEPVAGCGGFLFSLLFNLNIHLMHTGVLCFKNP